MAVRARADVTLAGVSDGAKGDRGPTGATGDAVKSVTTFWQLATSAPATPSGAGDPSGWSTTMPSVPDRYAGKLYRCTRTVLTSGTALWSAPAVDSSYDYSYRAWSTADAAVTQARGAKSAADEVSATLSQKYTTTADIQKTYATQAQLSAKADAITSSVSSTYATKAALDGLQVGGRNLLKGSSQMPQGYIGNGSVKVNADGSATVNVIAGYTWNRFGFAESAGNYNSFIPIGGAWAFSVDVRAHDDVKDKYYFGVYLSEGTGYFDVAVPKGTGWVRVKVTGHVRGGTLSNSLNVHFHFSRAGTYDVRNPKLESGTKATDWTPAPEDLQSDAASKADAALASAKSYADTKVQQTADSITATVKASYQPKGDYQPAGDYATSAQLKVTSDGLATEVAERQGLASRVTTVEQTSGSLTARFATALTGAKVEYALGDSATAAPASGWSATAPAWQAGRYMWQRTTVTKGDGTTSSTTTCVQGAKGDTGATGPQGLQGERGETGATGPQGPKGDDFDGNARLATIETLVRQSASGVEVGKYSGGKRSGPYALVNADGSFDIYDVSGNLLARMGGNSVSLASETAIITASKNKITYGSAAQTVSALVATGEDPNSGQKNTGASVEVRPEGEIRFVTSNQAGTHNSVTISFKNGIYLSGDVSIGKHPVADWVTSYGTTNGIGWEKYASGRCRLWGYDTASSDGSGAQLKISRSLPFAVKYVRAQGTYVGGSSWAHSKAPYFAADGVDATATSTLTFYAYPMKGYSGTYNVSWYINAVY